MPSYCVPSSKWPCALGKQYHGRGPMQLSYNFNYGPAGLAIGVDLLNNPDLVVSFKTALWFWMTSQGNKPSCHAVMTGQWTPTVADIAAGRLPGFGVVTNIINAQEVGKVKDARVADRIGFYKHFCDILDVGNLDCYNQRPFSQ